jgi:pseudaminic acid synthase
MRNKVMSMSKSITIAGRRVGDGKAPFIIAELSGNHSQSLATAKAMIVAAAKTGVDAVKLQTYTADTITIDCDADDFQITDSNNLWQGQTLYQLYEKSHTPWQWHEELFILAKSLGLIIFSSPFDETSVDFLENLNAPCYKIASFELNHTPLLRAVAKTGKPVIMSTGMATCEEITEAISELQHHGCQQLALMVCTSAYPANPSDANLATIADMKQRFNLPVGLSDHIQGVSASIVAVALGANLIERHFILDEESDGVDAQFSSTPEEMSLLIREANKLAHVQGEVRYGPTEAEQDSVKYRRSIYVAEPIKQGELLTEQNVKVVRPGFGMAPKCWFSVLGKTAKHNLIKGQPLLTQDVSGNE